MTSKFDPDFWQQLIPQQALSKFFGYLSNSKIVWLKNWMIRTFIRKYPVNMKEAVISDPKGYPDFNTFFTRALKPELRPIAPLCRFVSPVDGTVSAIGRVTEGQLFQAKNHHYSLQALLGTTDPTYLKPFEKALYTTIYLAPHDYHRIHMPVGGRLTAMRYIPGKLFSVNQKTADAIPNLFARNERVVLFFDTELGPLALVLVGAMIVASISTVFSGLVPPHRDEITHRNYPNTDPQHIFLAKGEEVAQFLLGSTVIALLGNEQISWLTHLEVGSPVQYGQPLVKTEAKLV